MIRIIEFGETLRDYFSIDQNIFVEIIKENDYFDKLAELSHNSDKNDIF